MATLPPPLPIEEQVKRVHEELRVEYPPIARLAVAFYDEKTDLLKTFVSSSGDQENPLPHYEAKLAEVPSLVRLAENRSDRVVDDLSEFSDSPALHSKVITEHYKSSYTRPLMDRERLRGFIFFDATETAYFTKAVVRHLSVYAELMAVLLSRSMLPASMLRSAVRVAADLTHSRDPETGAHLERMSRYSRLIALELAEELKLSDGRIEHIFVFAPLHDVGKVGIPDHVLLKQGRLTDDEMTIMKTHTTRGGEMIDRLLSSLALRGLSQASILRNIVLYHHEHWDGAGYPEGLAGSEIPIEARIITVADVYDALTSERPYKEAWSADKAFEFLRGGRGKQFDPQCVDALIARREEVEEIRRVFLDEDDAVRSREGYSEDL